MRRATFAVDIDGTVTEDGQGRIHLGALSALRHLAAAGHNVVYVSGRSSVEGFMLAVYGGTTRLAVGENGGCITTSPTEHALIGDRARCEAALRALRSGMDGVAEKPVFPRLTEVVLERTFDVAEGRRLVGELGLGVSLSDSGYAYHINSAGIDKGAGLRRAVEMLGGAAAGEVVAIGDSETDVPMFGAARTSVALGNAPDGVKAAASLVASAPSGAGVLEALDALAPRLSGPGGGAAGA